jgi:hypothetical protein
LPRWTILLVIDPRKYASVSPPGMIHFDKSSRRVM